MPIYEYRCTECETKFEELVLSDDHEVTCVSCGGSRVRKLLSSFSSRVGSTADRPACSDGCGSGFDRGACGSGMCCGGHGR